MTSGNNAKTTRRTFLGTAGLATAATLTAPVSGNAQTASPAKSVERVKVAEATTEPSAELMARAKNGDWTKPAAMAIPKGGYFELEPGRYPFVSADEIKKALKVKASLSAMLDQMQ